MASSLLFSMIVMLPLLVLGVPGAPHSCGPPVPYETPSCSVFSREIGYELRDYTGGLNYLELVLPNTTYKTASSAGLLRLAAYLKGDNAQGSQMPLMLPFIIHPVVKLNGYTVGVYLSNSIVNPPEPNDKAMKVFQTTRCFEAVLGPFTSPVVNETSFLHSTRELFRYLQRDRMDHDSLSVKYARYCNPFELFDRQQSFELADLEKSAEALEFLIGLEEVHVQIFLD